MPSVHHSIAQSLHESSISWIFSKHKHTKNTWYETSHDVAMYHDDQPEELQTNQDKDQHSNTKSQLQLGLLYSKYAVYLLLYAC